MQPYDIHKSAGIIIRDRKLLVTHTRGKSIFFAPGGKLDPGETSIQAVIRELGEEIQLQVTEKDLSLFGVYYAEAAGVENTGKRVRMDAYMEDGAGDVAPAHEIEEVRWISSAILDDTVVGSIFAHDILPRLVSLNLVD